MPTSPRHPAETLTNAALNRALLARQHLLERAETSPLALVRALVGLQSQNPGSAYLALWSRCAAFDPHTIGAALVARDLVRVMLMRATIHLVAADDALALRPLVQPMLSRVYRSQASARRASEGIAQPDLAAATRAAMGEGLGADHDIVRDNASLGAELAARWPDRERHPLTLGNTARALVPLVQVPPRGVWGESGAVRWALMDRWLGRAPRELSEPEADAALDALALRYLGAFGPASAADMQTWSNLGKEISAAFERLRARLVVFRAEDGRTLYDLPDAPRPDPATPAPPRFLPDYDNVLLGHADRTRLVSEPIRQRFMTPNSVAPGAVLVDGVVQGQWRLEAASAKAKKAGTGPTLTITLFAPVGARARTAVAAEGRRLATFLAGAAGEVRFVEEIVADLAAAKASVRARPRARRTDVG